ncbi:MAG: NAD(+)/NADH kinase [Kiritimatiellae bacterium]|nr:NAD(+)/NADH kinase [Kiritimatiellia bacterium]
MKLRFYVNGDKPGGVPVRERLAAAAPALGFEVVGEGPSDAVVALGGDGTILRAVHEFPGTPVLGLNLGGLGYLSSVGEKDFDLALQKLASGRYRISERCMIELNGRFAALNDIVVTKEMSGRSRLLDLKADGKLVTHYMADGLIFATPTGSTAYSLAAGGPVLMPDSGSIVVTPMNPHALAVRPLVVKDTVRFTVTARSRGEGGSAKTEVYADGADVLTLEDGASVEIAKAAATAKLVELEGYDPYEVLARKLGWSGSNVK